MAPSAAPECRTDPALWNFAATSRTLRLRPAKGPSQLQYPLSGPVPALGQEFAGVHIALLPHLVAASGKSEEPALGHVGQAVVATQTGDIDEMGAALPGLNLRFAAKEIVRMRVRMPSSPQIDRSRMGLQIILKSS